MDATTETYLYLRAAGQGRLVSPRAALDTARAMVAQGRRKYYSRRVMGSGPRAERERSVVTDDRTMFRRIEDVSGRSGGYRATDWSGPLVPHTARIGTARRDARTGERFGIWLSGYLETDSGYFVLDRVHTGECDSVPDDARRAADDAARRAAEDEAEYQDGWQHGREARDAIDDAAKDLGEAIDAARKYRRETREAVAAARSAMRGARTGFIPPGVWRAEIARARAAKEARVATIAEARKAWAAAWDAAREACPVTLGRPERPSDSPYVKGWIHAWES
jgi:hypothetical protein